MKISEDVIEFYVPDGDVDDYNGRSSDDKNAKYNWKPDWNKEFDSFSINKKIKLLRIEMVRTWALNVWSSQQQN